MVYGIWIIGLVILFYFQTAVRNLTILIPLPLAQGR